MPASWSTSCLVAGRRYTRPAKVVTIFFAQAGVSSAQTKIFLRLSSDGSGYLVVRSGDFQVADKESDGGAAAENAVAIGRRQFVVVVGRHIGSRTTRGRRVTGGAAEAARPPAREWQGRRHALRGLRDRPGLRRAARAAAISKDSAREKPPAVLHRSAGKTPRANVHRR